MLCSRVWMTTHLCVSGVAVVFTLGVCLKQEERWTHWSVGPGDRVRFILRTRVRSCLGQCTLLTQVSTRGSRKTQYSIQTFFFCMTYTAALMRLLPLLLILSQSQISAVAAGCSSAGPVSLTRQSHTSGWTKKETQNNRIQQVWRSCVYLCLRHVVLCLFYTVYCLIFFGSMTAKTWR